MKPRLQITLKLTESNSSDPMSRSDPDKGAFTLIEILVSMTVLAILLVILMSMVDGATKLWRQTENRVDSYREARAAVNMMAADLGSMYGSTNTNFFTIGKVPGVPMVLGSEGVFFLSAQPLTAQDPSDTNNVSDLCAVGYFLGYGAIDLTGVKSRNLYRYFRSSSSTFKDCLTNNQGQLIPTPLTTASTGDNVELLARNVTSFKPRAYSITSGTLTNFQQAAATPMPDVIELEITAINNDAAQRITDWSDTNSVIYKQNARTFTTRIQLNTKSANDEAAATTPSPTPGP
jgi:prepilin-type N-terminal cleavage/methylation domain-containing protein